MPNLIFQHILYTTDVIPAAAHKSTKLKQLNEPGKFPRPRNHSLPQINIYK